MNNKQIKNIFKEKTYIIIDTREQNQYIKDTFDKFGIKYKISKMNYGDFGIEVQGKRLKVAIERKANLSELGNNLTNNKTRFEREMQRCIDDDASMIIMIESESYSNICNEKYKNNITSKQYLGLLHSIYAKYNIPFIFIEKEFAPLFIYNILKYKAREYLKLKFF